MKLECILEEKKKKKKENKKKKIINAFATKRFNYLVDINNNNENIY